MTKASNARPLSRRDALKGVAALAGSAALNCRHEDGRQTLAPDSGAGRHAYAAVDASATASDGAAAGRDVPPLAGSAPSWYSAMNDKTWATIAAAGTIDAVKPSRHPGGTLSTNGPIAPWCGAALDNKRQELQIGAQGGHSDYYGNEVYVIALGSAAPAWARVSEPRYAFGSEEPYMDDRSPRAAHGQSQICYAANVDRYVLASMPYTAPEGNSSFNVFAFNRATNAWSELAKPPAMFGPVYSHGGACYDSMTGSIWIVVTTSDSNSTVQFDPKTDSYTLYDIANAEGYDGMAALSPSRGCMLYLNGSATAQTGQFVWLDTTNPSKGWMGPASVKGVAPLGAGAPLIWHEPSGAFLGWTAGTSIYKLTPPQDLLSGTWVWSQVLVASANAVTPSTASANGTFGRFNIVEDLAGSGRDCIVLVNHTQQATYVYRLPAGGLG